jgi:uncharacterized protein (DUF58 family)
VTRAANPRLFGYAALAALGLLGALALRRPELAVAAAPFALVLAIGSRARDPGVQVRFAMAAERTLEDTEDTAVVTVIAERAVDRLDFVLGLPRDVEVVDGVDAVSMRLAAGEERDVELQLRCRRWGVYNLGAVRVCARDRWRILSWQGAVSPSHRLRAYPRPLTLQRLVAPVRTQALAGSQVARSKGDGVEYADIRDFVPGDRVRSINWRASARRQGLVVNERHPERNTDVVLFVDSFTDVRDAGRSVLDEAVRAAAALAARHLEQRDRVGLVAYGGVLRWLQPGMGATQRYRLVETLLETGVEPTYAWRDVNIIPARILPPAALVFALTPLVDPRFVGALEDLRGRGYDVAVVEVDPRPMVRPGRSEVERVAHRLWLLEREVHRWRLESLGIAVSTWGNGELGTSIEEVRTFRRYAARAHA